MKFSHAKLLFSTLAVLALSGCGGGSNPFFTTVTKPAPTGDVPRATAVPSAPFAPNYLADIDSGFHWNHATLKVFIDAPMTDKRVALVKEATTHRDGSASFYCQDPDGNVVQVLWIPPTMLQP